MSRLIDADALERDVWRMSRTVQIDEKTMEAQTRKPTDFPAVEPQPEPCEDTISRQSAIQAAECIVDHHAITPYQTMRSAMDHLQRILRGMPSVQPESEEMLSGRVWDEWCTGCKEYDHKRHCCPRFRDVIFRTVGELTDNAYVEGYTAAEAKYREGLQDAE